MIHSVCGLGERRVMENGSTVEGEKRIWIVDHNGFSTNARKSQTCNANHVFCMHRIRTQNRANEKCLTSSNRRHYWNGNNNKKECRKTWSLEMYKLLCSLAGLKVLLEAMCGCKWKS